MIDYKGRRLCDSEIIVFRLEVFISFVECANRIRVQAWQKWKFDTAAFCKLRQGFDGIVTDLCNGVSAFSGVFYAVILSDCLGLTGRSPIQGPGER